MSGTPLAVHDRIDSLMVQYEEIFGEPWPNAEMYGMSPETQLVMLDRAIKNRQRYRNSKAGVDY